MLNSKSYAVSGRAVAQAMPRETVPARLLRWMMIPALAVALAMTLMMSILMSAPADATDRMERTVRVNGKSREYVLHMPRTQTDGHKHPILFVFHPGGAQAGFMEENAPFYTTPGAEDYVVVYPEGVGRTFNAGVCCGSALERGVDDVAFFKAMMADVGSIVAIREEAYVTGFSNGAMMTYRLVCEVPQMIAAAVPYAAAVPMDNCVSGKPVPLMHLNGGADTQALYGGPRKTPSPFKKTAKNLTPPLEALGAVARRNACSQEMIPARSIPAMDADCERFSGCPTSAPVLMCVIPDLGHAWPGSGDSSELAGSGTRRPRLFDRLGRNKDAAAGENELTDRFGPYRPELDATGSIVAFFNRF